METPMEVPSEAQRALTVNLGKCQPLEVLSGRDFNVQQIERDRR
jgi:hypothetical protein